MEKLAPTEGAETRVGGEPKPDSGGSVSGPE